jgi:hypothetical protein
VRNTVPDDLQRDVLPDEPVSSGARFLAEEPLPSQPAAEVPPGSGPLTGLGVPSPQAPAYGTSAGGYPQEPVPPSAYPPPTFEQPAAYPQAPVYPQAPGAYPQAPGAYPQASAFGSPVVGSSYPPVTGGVYPAVAPAGQVPEVPERVGRGLLFALGAVVAGIVVAVVLWQIGFIASFTSLLLASGAVWLYQKGAGTAPRKGALPLIFLILVGAALALAISMGFEVFRYVLGEGFDVGESLQFALAAMFNPVLWRANATSAVMFIAFAALGSVGVLRTLFRTKP